MIKVYGDLGSGNCLKVKWTCDRLEIPYEWIEVDIMNGESRTPEFLAMNPFGQVPTVLLDDGRPLSQSNAIMSYLASDSPLYPSDPYVRSQIDAFLFWEQNSHEFFLAGCRFQMVYLGLSRESRDPIRVERGEQALDQMNEFLADQTWFVGNSLTIADMALLAYTRLANEGGFDLTSRPNVKDWIKCCELELTLGPVSQ